MRHRPLHRLDKVTVIRIVGLFFFLRGIIFSTPLGCPKILALLL
jgi:hypothetical protein